MNGGELIRDPSQGRRQYTANVLESVSFNDTKSMKQNVEGHHKFGYR